MGEIRLQLITVGGDAIAAELAILPGIHLSSMIGEGDLAACGAPAIGPVIIVIDLRVQ